jgi:hypothetical protein
VQLFQAKEIQDAVSYLDYGVVALEKEHWILLKKTYLGSKNSWKSAVLWGGRFKYLKTRALLAFFECVKYLFLRIMLHRAYFCGII